MLKCSSAKTGIVGLTYLDAAATLFGERAFSVSEFADRIGTPRAAKVLNEMKTRGLVERVGRGRYRILRPSERPDLRRVEWRRIRDAVLEAPMWKAWADASAVEAWTEGRYKVSPSPFIRDFHVAVHESDVAVWWDYLKVHRIPTGGKHIGGHVRLEPVPDDFAAERVHGEPVIPRRDVVRLIRSKPALYGDAEALLA